ncbi:MAG: hypothetical protein FD147_408 [Chloroflexi bacterium]|nr:MAG: hypothetical protein FD147_408 [Chloroflexota bacterium]
MSNGCLTSPIKKPSNLAQKINEKSTYDRVIFGYEFEYVRLIIYGFVAGLGVWVTAGKNAGLEADGDGVIFC